MKSGFSVILIVVLVAVLALVAACGGGNADAPKDNPPPAAGAQSSGSDTNAAKPAEQKPEASAPTQVAKSASPVEERDATEAKDLALITSIKSYRSLSGMKVDGKTAGGEAYQAGMETITEITLDPPAEHSKTQLTGEGAKDPMAAALFGERYQVGNEFYYQVQGKWKKSTYTGDAKDLIDSDLSSTSPDEINELIKVATRVGRETLNGRSTTHYRIDKAGLIAIDEAEKKREAEEEDASEEDDWYDDEEDEDDGIAQFAKAGDAYADIWLDNGEGFTVKYVLTIEGDNLDGTSGPDGKPISGTFTFFSEYKDINADFTIEVPDEVKNSATE